MHAYPAHRPIDDWAATISKPNGWTAPSTTSVGGRSGTRRTN